MNPYDPKTLSEHWHSFFIRHPKAKTVFKGFGYLFSERMLKFLVGFFVHAMVARHLGPAHFGKLSYVIKTVNIFYTFSLFGVDEIIIKHLMESTYQRMDILKTVFRMRLVMSFIGLFSLGIFLFIFQPENDLFRVLTFIYGLNIILQSFNLFELSFQSQMRFKPLFWANNISYITSSTLRVLGVWWEMGVSFFLSTYLVGEIILKSLIQRKMGFKIFEGVYIPALAKTIAQDSFPYFISAFVALLDQRLSFIFIERNLASEELGNYSVAVTLVDLWLFLPMAVLAASFPTIVTAFNGAKAEFHDRIQYLADVMVWSGIVFFVGVSITSGLVIKLLYGSKYAHADEILSWYALTTIPVFFNLARIKWMALEKHLNDWLWTCSVCLGLNCIGHYYLVPMYGVKGAIMSFLISQLLGNLILSFFISSTQKSMKIFFKSLIAPIRWVSKLR